jgi:tRNA(Arg) A34 adenosine deaminase TadA
MGLTGSRTAADLAWMRRALDEAQAAAEAHEVPFGTASWSLPLGTA